MVKHGSLLRGKNVAVIGFNARPLACSAKRAGAHVYVSDYWGDDDLAACCNEWISVLNPKPGFRQRQHLEQPMYLSLTENLIDLTDGIEIDYLFVGSGFDDHKDGLEKLHRSIGITGNSPDVFEASRNSLKLQIQTKKHGLLYPENRFVSKPEGVLDACESIGFPCIIRPVSSGGGGGISLVRSPEDIAKASDRATRETSEPGFNVQQYVRGIDGSSSVLSTGTESFTLSIQGQLIGMPSAGRNCDFVFSGNYFPLGVDREAKSLIENASVGLCNDLGLVGSNGVDFVLDEEGNVWLMEINPRFQGTLEMLEVSGSVSLAELHTSACSGHLPAKEIHFQPAVKMIVYSRKTGAVSDLSRFDNTVDRTPPGVHVKRGDPICTTIETGKHLGDCYKAACMVAQMIQSEVGT
jgi:predicted ATP-grasp superfamily ATP-dependent carboligase